MEIPFDIRNQETKLNFLAINFCMHMLIIPNLFLESLHFTNQHIDKLHYFSFFIDTTITTINERLRND